MNLNVMQDVVRSKQSLEASDQEEERMIITDDSSGNFDVEIDGSDEERDWGWLNCKPTCLQWLNTSRWMLTIVCVLTIFQGMAVYSFVPMSIPSLEKRFLLNSKQTGFIISSMDITSMIFGTLISFYGGHSHKGKWLGLGAIITGIASCLYSLPHFLNDEYNPTSVLFGRSPHCYINSNSTSTVETSCTLSLSTSSSWSPYYYVFVISQLFAGIGSAPMLTITPAWLDENVHPKHASLYLGIFFSSFVLGPSIGSLIAGKLLEIYVEITQSSGVHINTRDPRWIGAWWIGPLSAGLILLVCGFLLLGFPSKLPGSQRIRREAIQNGYILKKNNNLSGKLKNIIPATKLLFVNKTYIFHVLAMITGTFAWYGAGPFLFKLIVDRYGTPQFLAGMMMFLMSLIGGNIGLWIGSIVVTFLGLKDSCRKAAKFVFFVNIFTLSILSFLVPGCIYPRYAGVDVPYVNSTSSTGLLNTCNRDCQCSTSKYMPMCGPEDINYFSPCYAGCPPQDPSKVYANCSCVIHTKTNPFTNGNATKTNVLKSGLCKKECNYRYLFFGFLFAMTIIGVSDSIPSEIVMFRSVPDNQRSYALGIQFVFSKLMASVPGPIIIGYVIDETCSLWKTKPCGQRGNCLNYDYDKLGWIIVSYAIPLKALSLLLYFLSWYYCKDLPQETDNKNTNTAHDPGKITAV